MVTILGLDKMRSTYFHNSRMISQNSKLILTKNDIWNLKNGHIKIPLNVIAIKSMEIIVRPKIDSLDRKVSLYIKYDFDFGHGNMLNMKLGFEDVQFNKLKPVTLANINFLEDNYGTNYNLKNFAETVKSYMKGGHTLKMEI